MPRHIVPLSSAALRAGVKQHHAAPSPVRRDPEQVRAAVRTHHAAPTAGVLKRTGWTEAQARAFLAQHPAPASPYRTR